VDDCYPGQVMLVDAAWGGYDVRLGFTGANQRPKDESVPTQDCYRVGEDGDNTDRAQGRDDLSVYPWKTIATHGGEVADEARRLGQRIGLDENLISLLNLAGRLHDWGKAHRAFQSS